jgi:hypothetical protein
MINTLAVVLLIPIYDKGLVPLLRKLKRPITLLQRIGKRRPLRLPGVGVGVGFCCVGGSN